MGRGGEERRGQEATKGMWEGRKKTTIAQHGGERGLPRYFDQPFCNSYFVCQAFRERRTCLPFCPLLLHPATIALKSNIVLSGFQSVTVFTTVVIQIFLYIVHCLLFSFPHPSTTRQPRFTLFNLFPAIGFNPAPSNLSSTTV